MYYRRRLIFLVIFILKLTFCLVKTVYMTKAFIIQYFIVYNHRFSLKILKIIYTNGYGESNPIQNNVHDLSYSTTRKTSTAIIGKVLLNPPSNAPNSVAGGRPFSEHKSPATGNYTTTTVHIMYNTVRMKPYKDEILFGWSCVPFSQLPAPNE